MVLVVSLSWLGDDFCQQLYVRFAPVTKQIGVGGGTCGKSSRSCCVDTGALLVDGGGAAAGGAGVYWAMHDSVAG